MNPKIHPSPTNPWLVASAQSYQPGAATQDGHDRIEQIRNTKPTLNDMAWLRLVIQWPDNQKTVQAAAESKMRAHLRQTRPTSPTGPTTPL